MNDVNKNLADRRDNDKESELIEFGQASEETKGAFFGGDDGGGGQCWC